MALIKHPCWVIVSLLLILQLLSLTVSAAECSGTNHCKIGCCSKHGFCGTTSDHCGAGCQSTCDYQPPPTECSQTRLCATGCCSKHGFCGTTEEHCGQGCQSTCNYKPPPTECSQTRLCATGCCSKHGFCGTTEEHCGKGCQSTCDFKLGCDGNNPCKDGTCCSKFGFCGLGPDYCTKENCVAGCDAKTFCDPGGYGPEFAKHSKCPLNVCCSKWGYCGMTPEFCGDKKVTRPSCSAKNSPMRRVVGYYEGWATGRSCDQFRPSDIPDGVYTHINFAFASIDPNTFEIVPAAKGDPELYRQLTRKKEIDPNLRVFIAIGGWAFNDPGPTVTTFSDIARSSANQRVFIRSLIAFMNTYDFDGVDIDWEYPVAPDRQGRGEDLKNLPKFLYNIKNALKQNGIRNGLSIAIPASYWYLQHFDIVKISAHVDFFNIMTYDFHGSWDTPKSWLGNHLNSHTNLTEIKDALDLLWRNQIDPDQVNLGLAFYSRTFTVSDAGCMFPGCLFDSGGPKAPCTDAIGVMSNSEVMRKLSEKSSQVELNEAAAVKIVKSGREWLTYDDADTWKLKLDFARGQCLGGAMVWAISQDTSDGKFSRELQSITGYKSRAVTTFAMETLPVLGDYFTDKMVSEASSDVIKEQCRWSNCGKVCPSGWQAVRRSDPYKHSIKELMLDDTGCDGNFARTFCCPPGDQPVCQWLFFNGGKCNPGCPEDQYEVASNKAGCNNGKAQVACCSGTTTALDIYRRCQWYGKEHKCAIDLGTKLCSWSNTFNTPLTSSWDGSGAQFCRDSDSRRGMRDYCCDVSDSSNAHWKNCDWYDNFGLGLTPIADFEQCNGNCPAGKIKVALEKNEYRCKHGTMAYCCDAEVTASAKDKEKKKLKDALSAWVKNPTCPNTGKRLSSRSSATQAGGQEIATIFKRNQQPQPSSAVVQNALQDIIGQYSNSKLTKHTRKTWDDTVLAKWKHLSAATLSNMWSPFKGIVTSTELVADAILCNMNEWNEELEKEDESHTSILQCPLKALGAVDSSLLEDPEDVAVDEESTALSAISAEIPRIWSLGHFDIKRGYGSVRKFPVACPNGDTFEVFSQKYINGDNGDALAKANNDQKRYYVNNQGGSCHASGIAGDGDRDDAEWVSEHILELQTFRDFIEYTMSPTIQDKARSVYGVRPPKLANTAKHMATCAMWKGPFRNGFNQWTLAGFAVTPMKLTYSTLGSIDDSSDMVNCEKKLNSMKARVWSLIDPISVDKWNSRCAHMTQTSAQNAITTFELIWGVWEYLNYPAVKSKLVTVHMAVADNLQSFERHFLEEFPRVPAMDLEASHWREFMAKHFERMLITSRGWVQGRLDDLTKDWTEHLNNLLQRSASGANVANDISIARQALTAFAQRAQSLDAVFTFDTDIFLNN